MEKTMLAAEDKKRLRDLAKRVREIAEMPIMSERKDLWKKHNKMEKSRPLVYIDPQGAWGELVAEDALQCAEQGAREIERKLLRKIYAAEHFSSDNVIEAEWIVPKVFHSTGWGLEPRRSHEGQGERGAFGFEPVLKDGGDLKKLRIPEIEYDEKETMENLTFFQSLFDDILNVRLKGIDSLSYHLMNQYTALRGLQETLEDMILNPEMIHDAMAFLEEGHRRLLHQYVEQNLLGLNNDNTALYTSGYGYTDELPQSDYDAKNVKPQDIWCWAEAQEMAVVSPEMHKEFAFDYEKRLLEPFGLNGYGCCDDVTNKLDFVLTVPRLRRVSVSPWANVDLCAERIKGNVIFMWKPQPAHLVGDFNVFEIEKYIRHTVEAANVHGCILEIVLLDTHTCESHPERFDTWSQIASKAANDNDN